jgi:hypothetical protein
VMIPTRKPARSGEMLGYPSGRSDFTSPEMSMYSTLQTVAQTYGIPIVANAYLTETPPRSARSGAT